MWEPPSEQRERVEMGRFMEWAAERHGRAFAGYDELWQWSVDELEDFWASVWEFCGVRASKPYERVLGRSRETRAPGPNPRFDQREMPGARWFVGAELNYVQNVFRHASAERAALVFQSVPPALFGNTRKVG